MPLDPAEAKDAPISPPMSAYAEEDGIPIHQVRKFQIVAPTTAASVMNGRSPKSCRSISPKTVNATALPPRSAPRNPAADARIAALL